MNEKKYRKKIVVSVLGRNISENTGINVRAKSIAELIEEAYGVTLIGRGNRGEQMKNTILITPEKTKLWNLKLVPVIIQNKFDCAYCVGDIFGFLTFYVLSKVYHYRTIFDATGIYSNIATSPRYLGSMIYKILERFVVKHADCVTAVAGYILDFYRKCNNITLLPLFVDEERFKKAEIKSECNCKKGNRLLGMIGPFDSSSNRHYLTFLKANLDRFSDRVDFKLIGRCDCEILNERVRYTGYLNSVEDYVNQLSSVDAVLLPCKPQDPGPYTKIIESMSCALPVFTTPEGIIGLDHVTPGKDILVFEEEKLVAKINESIFNNKLMIEIGKNARITVEKYYSRKANKATLLNVLEGF